MRTEFNTTNLLVAGTEQQLSTAVLKVRAVLFHARSTNPGAIYIGHSSAVSATNGLELVPDRELLLSYGNFEEAINTFWIDAALSSSRLDWLAFYQP